MVFKCQLPVCLFDLLCRLDAGLVRPVTCALPTIDGGLTSKEQNNKTVRALTVRISLSVIAFILLMVAIGFGWIEPHGLNPNQQ